MLTPEKERGCDIQAVEQTEKAACCMAHVRGRYPKAQIILSASN